MIGELINEKYKIEAAFSESHMYEIFSALEIATGTSVIIKILKDEMAGNPDRIRGFSNEIKGFAALSHPLIAEVLDVDMYGDRPYVVSPVIKGRDLYSILSEETLSFADSVKIVQDLATVLQYASDQKVEYRTIKLSNVLRRDDGHITVLSFTHPRLKLASNASRSETAGTHSDLFFLGSTLYEMLAGESPIRKRGGINELWDMKIEKLLRIRHADLLPEQQSRIVDFIRKTLTREMGNRFGSHEEFLKALADLSGNIREKTIRSKARQLSMASQVVDALNGRMSNVNMAAVATGRSSGKSACGVAVASCDSEEAPVQSVGFAETGIEGNLALVVDNSGRDEGPAQTVNEKTAAKSAARSHLRLVKSETTPVPAAEASAWKNSEDQHWLKNPVIFMGLCLAVMVFLILFW